MSNALLTGPFSLGDVRFREPWRQAAVNVLRRPMEKMFGLRTLNELYGVAQGLPREESFLERSLAAMNVSYEVVAGDLAKIPAKGGCVVVSNHPFGGLDGVVLAAMLRKVRPDCKVMANFLLARVPELHEVMIFVDPFGGREAARRNLAAIRQCLEHVKAGGMLVIFPAGEVSHVDLAKQAVEDKPWSETVARIVRRTGAPVLPVFFGGSNGMLFNLAGMIHPALRTAMLPRELLKKRRTCVPVRIGGVIQHRKLAGFETDKEMMSYLRLRSYILQTRPEKGAAAARETGVLSEISPAEDPRLLAEDVQGLGAEALLIENADYAVYAARAAEIPHVLFEIGRLREKTFRGVHEGTGKAVDLDGFDQTYIHLFAWHKAKGEVVGAYRMGPTDEILPRQGVKGLYTRTCFRYGERVLEQLGPALELGRSFVREEYQRCYSPLMLLWKGIGRYVHRNPRYNVLFGTVSISREYASFSRQLIMQFLEMTSASGLAGLVKGLNPPRDRQIKPAYLKEYSHVVKDMDEVSDLVAEIEADGKGIPILLKQYMKLSAKFLGFNIDPDFGDVLDGLMVVDLREVDPKLAERFTGRGP